MGFPPMRGGKMDKKQMEELRKQSEEMQKSQKEMERLMQEGQTGKAMEMVLSGDLIDAAEARADGLVQRVVPDAELEATVDALATRIAANAPIAVQLGKHLIRMSESVSVDVGLKWENDLFTYCFTTDDAQEGIAAFREKRAPIFQGR